MKRPENDPPVESPVIPRFNQYCPRKTILTNSTVAMVKSYPSPDRPQSYPYTDSL